MISIDDEYVRSLFKTERYRINPSLLKHYIKKDAKHDVDVWKYVDNRFSDSKSWIESLCRIVFSIYERPRCKECGKELDFKYDLANGCFRKYCSYHCQSVHLNKIGKLNSEKSVGLAKATRAKTMVAKYGVDNPFKLQEVRDRIRESLIAKYGVDNPFKVRELFDYKKQYEHQAETKAKNHTFSTSKEEDALYVYIREKFPDVVRQHRDSDRYPFFCDFYIPSIDLFIELNAHWTHGKHPYNKDDECDQKTVEKWKAKHTKYYDNAIRTWTCLDVKKRTTAAANSLYYIEAWTLDEGKRIIDNIYLLHMLKF